MKTLFSKISILLLVLFSFSCEKGYDKGIRQYCFMADFDDNITYELTCEWIFFGYGGLIDSKCKPDDIREMTIEFRADNIVVGMSSCNAFVGYYSITNENSLHIDNIGTTLIYCIDDTVRYWEKKYYYSLENAISYDITGNRLIINTNSGEKMIFGTF
jgi:hypothetical protein